MQRETERGKKRIQEKNDALELHDGLSDIQKSGQQIWLPCTSSDERPQRANFI